MKHIQLTQQIILLGILYRIVLVAGAFTVEKSACQTGSVDLIVKYTGSGTVGTISWKFSKMTDPTKTLNVVTALCLASAGADPAFPVSRMTYTCDDSDKRYTITITDFDESTDAGTWEASVSVGGTFTDFSSLIVTCSSTITPNTSSSSNATNNTNTTHAATSTQPSTTTTKSPDNKTIIIIIVIVAVVVVVAVIIMAIICFCIRKKIEIVKKTKRENNKKEHETVDNVAMQQAADARL